MIFRVKRQKNTFKENISNHKMELLVKLGGDQFKKLIEKGISVPVAIL